MAMDRWLRTLDVGFESLGWDLVLRRAEVEWHRGARLGEVVDIDSTLERWGTTSFVVRHELSVQGRAVVTALVTYVGVEAGTTRPIPPPASVRAHLGEPSR